MYLAAIPTVLHVDPIVAVIPDAFNSKEAFVYGTVALSCECVDVEALWHFPLARKNQHPGVDPQTIQRVWIRLFSFLQQGENGSNKLWLCDSVAEETNGDCSTSADVNEEKRPDKLGKHPQRRHTSTFQGQRQGPIDTNPSRHRTPSILTCSSTTADSIPICPPLPSLLPNILMWTA